MEMAKVVKLSASPGNIKRLMGGFYHSLQPTYLAPHFLRTVSEHRVPHA